MKAGLIEVLLWLPGVCATTNLVILELPTVLAPWGKPDVFGVVWAEVPPSKGKNASFINSWPN